MASDLPVDLLEDIFLRLDDAADLARASATCAAFHRAISDSRFLRRFRSMHRRPVLGLLADKKRHFETEVFFPAQPPRRSAQAAAGFAKAADFTFSFLPDSKRWCVCNVRDGRLLLIRGHRSHRKLSDLEVDLVVYDPLHRRHVQIPTIPGDLLQSAKPDDYNEAMKFDDPFLAPAAADDDKDQMDEGEGFQVMFAALFALLSKTKVVAFVFSSASGQWRCVTSFSTGLSNYFCMDFECKPSVWLRQYVHGCVCWAHHFENVMLVLDTHEMKLSIAELPDESIGMSKMAVEAEDGRLGLLVFSDRDECTAMDLYSKALQGIQEPDDEWRYERSIPLTTSGFDLMLLHGAAEGYVLLLGCPRLEYGSDGCKEKPEAHYFTLELKTSLVEKLSVLEYDIRRRSLLYASFPPPFSTPSVCNCKNLSFSLPSSTTETCEDINLAELFY